MSAQFQVNHIANPYIDYPKEALISLFELALIENLHSNYRGILDSSRK
jgi:hypothetical protein